MSKTKNSSQANKTSKTNKMSMTKNASQRNKTPKPRRSQV